MQDATPHHRHTHPRLKEIIMAAIEDAIAAALDVDGKVDAYIDTLVADKATLEAENAALTQQVAALTATAAAQDAVAAQLTDATTALAAKLPPAAVPALDPAGNPLPA